MIYKDAGNKGIGLSYEIYKESLAEQPLHKDIIQTLKQYILDTQDFFARDFLAEKMYIVIYGLYEKETAIQRYNENTNVLSTILATYCLRYVLEELREEKE